MKYKKLWVDVPADLSTGGGTRPTFRVPPLSNPMVMEGEENGGDRVRDWS